MSASIAFWRAEHSNFAHLLDLLEKSLAAFHTDAAPDYALMLDIVTYLLHFPDRYHHPREDIAFTHIQRRDATLAPLLERLRKEHRQIAQAGEKLRAMLAAAADEAMIPRAEIETAAREYLAAYRDHIVAEELNVMPHAGALLTDEDWADVAHAIPAEIDPLFGAEADAAYRQLRLKIALESV